MRESYETYSQINPKNEEKSWIPNSCCSTSAIKLRSVHQGDSNCLFAFSFSTIWREAQKQKELNDLIRDRNLSKNEAEILGSRHKEKNLLKTGMKIS